MALKYEDFLNKPVSIPNIHRYFQKRKKSCMHNEYFFLFKNILTLYVIPNVKTLTDLFLN